jgi:short-subunit dehydrogenase
VTWVIVGASAGLGRALAERLARDRAPLLLVASDERDLAALRADLEIRHGARVSVLAGDAASPAALAEAVAAALAPGEPVAGLLFPLGLSVDDDDLSAPPALAARLAAVNFLAVAAVCARLLPRMLERGSGAIAGFGSVAAARGRARNVVYAASKRALESYFESLRHAAFARGVSVSFYVLGYMDTALAFGKALPFPAADPADVAARVVADLARGRGGTRHLPAWWAPVTAAVRALPWAVFRRMRF